MNEEILKMNDALACNLNFVMVVLFQFNLCYWEC